MPRENSVAVPRELCSIARDVAQAPAGSTFANNMQVTEDQSQEGAGGRGVPESLLSPPEPPPRLTGLPAPPATGLSFARALDALWYYPSVSGPVLAFDIETTGFRDADRVTCVCAYEPSTSLEFSRVLPSGDRCDEFLDLLDGAPLLCAFNGVSFDLPFMARRWDLSPSRVSSWVRKLVDPFQACKLCLGLTFSLDSLLSCNGLPVKTASGKEAVDMFHDGRWGQLAEYCMQDTKRTHLVATAPALLLPRTLPFKKKN